MDYKELVKRLIEGYQDMLGDVAYTQAGKVEGLEVVKAEVSGEINSETVTDLVEIYKEIVGQGSYGVARKTVKKIYHDDSSVAELDIPEKIKPKELKAESFASAL
ncbi:MAG: hypothetical protein ACI83Q_000190 [Colwellia polaris]|jgi:hypothetical protein